MRPWQGVDKDKEHDHEFQPFFLLGLQRTANRGIRDVDVDVLAFSSDLNSAGISFCLWRSLKMPCVLCFLMTDLEGKFRLLHISVSSGTVESLLFHWRIEVDVSCMVARSLVQSQNWSHEEPQHNNQNVSLWVIIGRDSMRMNLVLGLSGSWPDCNRGLSKWRLWRIGCVLPKSSVELFDWQGGQQTTNNKLETTNKPTRTKNQKPKANKQQPPANNPQQECQWERQGQCQQRHAHQPTSDTQVATNKQRYHKHKTRDKFHQCFAGKQGSNLLMGCESESV